MITKEQHTMQKLLSYTTTFLIIALLLCIVYLSHIKNQRDKIQHNLTLAEQQINNLVDINKNLSGSIDLLEQQAQQNRRYIYSLEQKRKQTQKQTDQLMQQFKRLKNENKTVNNWANQSLPTSLHK